MRIPTSLLAGVCFTLLAVGAAHADPLTITPIGTPGFQIVDYHMFTTQIGTAADSYAEFYKVLPSILPAPYYQYYPSQNNVGPTSTPNPGPYTNNIANGLTALGIADKTTFQTSDFSKGNGVYDAFMVVPTAGAPTGSSADSKSGPIIPNAVFPLTQSGTLFRNGVFYDTFPASTNYPSLKDFDPTFANLDGWSHFPIDGGESSDFGPASTPIDGHYTFDFKLIDANANGYDVTGGFTVVAPAVASPEPTSLTLGGVALLGAFGYGWRRRFARNDAQ